MADVSGFIGKQVGSYRVVKELNSGSYGSVYEGRHLIFEDEPVVAIKVLHAHLSSPAERAQFITEAQLLKKLRHPYILPIIDAGIHEGVPFIVTEYAAGGSLQDRLKQQPQRPLPLEEALSILAQVGQALQYAHQQHIVHRDLKPDNILFDAQGNALLADFGIATVLATAGTKDLGLGGTPPYMAPEQFEGMVSMKSDQYALGCIAYELCTGQRCFSLPADATWMAWAYKHTIEPPTPPTHINPRLPLHIEQAILTALAKQRADRYSDISAFLAALQEPQKTSGQWFDEGNALYGLKRYEEALAAYEQALRLDLNSADAYNNKGIALIGLKRYEEAVAAYEQALRLDPNDANAYNNKGNALNDLKRYEEAVAAYEQALRLDPNKASAYNNKGNALLGLKRYEEARASCEQALRLDPNKASAYNNKGNALLGLKRYEEAVAAYEQALRLDPNYANAYNNKGNVLRNLKRFEEALASCEQALRLDPNYANAYYNKGNVLRNLKRFEEALAAYEQALRLDPNDATAYYNKGNVLRNLKRFEEALAAYEQALRLDPNYAIAYYNKGLVLERLGKGREAQQAYEKAKQLGYSG